MSAPDRAPRDAALVALFLAGPLLFAADMAASYFLVPHAVRAHDKTALHALAAAALLATVAVSAAGARLWRALPPAGEGGDGAAQRRRFLAAGAMVLGAFSALLVVGNSVGKFVHGLGE